MKLLPILCVAGASALLSACATTPRTPTDLAHIQLVGENSAAITVGEPLLERSEGRLLLKGYVVRRLDATTTAETHLDVELTDSAGAVLRASVEHFEPRNLPRRHKRRSFGHYQVPMDSLPANTMRIVVRAHDGAHSS